MDIEFEKSIQKLNPYFHNLSYKYEMEPHISSDDIYQICLTSLFNMVSHSEEKLCDSSFEALAKTLAKNAVVDEMRRYATQSRDRSKEVREMKSSDGDVLSIFDFIGDNRPNNNPEELAIYNDMVEKMTSGLDAQELQLFNELTDPCSKSWDLLDDRVASGKGWNKPTYTMIAKAMDISVARMRGVLYRLRDKMQAFFMCCPTCGGQDLNKELVQQGEWLYGCDNVRCSNNQLFTPGLAL